MCGVVPIFDALVPTYTFTLDLPITSLYRPNPPILNVSVLTCQSNRSTFSEDLMFTFSPAFYASTTFINDTYFMTMNALFLALFSPTYATLYCISAISSAYNRTRNSTDLNDDGDSIGTFTQVMRNPVGMNSVTPGLTDVRTTTEESHPTAILLTGKQLMNGPKRKFEIGKKIFSVIDLVMNAFVEWSQWLLDYVSLYESMYTAQRS